MSTGKRVRGQAEKISRTMRVFDLRAYQPAAARRVYQPAALPERRSGGPRGRLEDRCGRPATRSAIRSPRCDVRLVVTESGEPWSGSAGPVNREEVQQSMFLESAPPASHCDAPGNTSRDDI